MTRVADASDEQAPQRDPTRAKRFFDRARAVGEAGQHDYAIEMYVEGLSFDPEDSAAYNELRRVGLTRKAAGGKKLGTFAAMKLKTNTKDPKQNLLNAAKLLAYDPGEMNHMVAMAKAAAKGGYRQAAMWIGPILFRVNAEGKDDPNIYLTLKDVYKEVGEFKLASDALGRAAASRPDDGDLQHEARELAARMTISQGNYGGGGDFRSSVRDADAQRALIEEEMDIRSPDAMAAQIARHRREWEESGREPAKLGKLVEALTKTEDLEHENEAIDLLEAVYRDTNSYRYRYSAEEIKLKQMHRFERSLREQIEANPDDQDLKPALAEQQQERLHAELKHYQTAMKAYPTDMRMRFEVGKRLFELGQFGEAIPMLQQAQNDAKYRDDAAILLGRAFLEAEFVDEAVDTLRGKIETYQLGGDNKSKEMYYWYGRSLEAKGDAPEAAKAYSQIAQWDFGYRDVQQRIKDLRARK